MITITVLTIIILFIISSPLWINILTHKKMTTDKTKQWGYGNFETFKVEFKKRTWDNDEDWPHSFFDYSTNSEIHAGIYKFNGIGMVILNPIEYVKVIGFLRENENPRRKKQRATYNWQQLD